MIPLLLHRQIKEGSRIRGFRAVEPIHRKGKKEAAEALFTTVRVDVDGNTGRWSRREQDFEVANPFRE
jgi:hypothetical protein